MTAEQSKQKKDDRNANTGKIHKRTKQADFDTISNRANAAGKAGRRRDSERDSERSARKRNFMEKRRKEIGRLA